MGVYVRILWNIVKYIQCEYIYMCIHYIQYAYIIQGSNTSLVHMLL